MESNNDIACRKGCGFFGSTDTGQLCSQCYKDEMEANEHNESSDTTATILLNKPSFQMDLAKTQDQFLDKQDETEYCNDNTAELSKQSPVACTEYNDTLAYRIRDVNNIIISCRSVDNVHLLDNSEKNMEGKNCTKCEIKDENKFAVPCKSEKNVQFSNKAENSKVEDNHTKFCADHGGELFFFCDTHRKFICNTCCIIDHHKDKCKLLGKDESLKKSVDKCKKEIDVEKKEYKEFESKSLSYIRILKQEEEKHSNLHIRLSDLSSHHEGMGISIASERKTVEGFLSEQELNIDKMESLRNVNTVASIKESADHLDATKSSIMISKTNRLEEEIRFGNFMKLDTSIQARQTTEKEIRTLTDTNEVETSVCELKGSSRRNLKIDLIAIQLLWSMSVAGSFSYYGESANVICLYFFMFLPLIYSYHQIYPKLLKLLFEERTLKKITNFIDFIFVKCFVMLQVINILYLISSRIYNGMLVGYFTIPLVLAALKCFLWEQKKDPTRCLLIVIEAWVVNTMIVTLFTLFRVEMSDTILFTIITVLTGLVVAYFPISTKLLDGFVKAMRSKFSR